MEDTSHKYSKLLNRMPLDSVERPGVAQATVTTDVENPGCR
ncbi:hypothetical protein [Photorhabdus stackebrandtii]